MLNEEDDVVDTIFTAPVLLLISSSFDDGAVESAVLVVNSIRTTKYGCAGFDLCTSRCIAPQFEELRQKDRGRRWFKGLTNETKLVILIMQKHQEECELMQMCCYGQTLPATAWRGDLKQFYSSPFTSLINLQVHHKNANWPYPCPIHRMLISCCQLLPNSHSNSLISDHIMSKTVTLLKYAAALSNQQS